MGIRHIILLTWALTGAFMVQAQTEVLTLEDCKQLALQNNHELAIQQAKQSIARDTKSTAKTLYLPKFDLTGAYMHTSREISILSDDQKTAIGNIGTTTGAALSEALPGLITSLVQGGIISPTQVQAMQQIIAQQGGALSTAFNQIGEQIVDAFHTDTRNMWVGAVTMTQPLYMGGKIIAANKMADIGIEAAANQTEKSRNDILLSTEKAYWLVASLAHKHSLAQSYCDLLRKFQSDVEKMVREGVATKADKLSVDVKVNEAEMTLTQVSDGLILSKMALCQVCGLSIDSNITTADETSESIDDNGEVVEGGVESALTARSEIRLLDNLTDISKQKTKIARAGYLPEIALTAGYMLTNPSLYNGFERKFKGMWNVGVMLSMPLWHWNDVKYKVNSAKSSTLIAEMQKEEAEELITLQVRQSQFKLKEARKKSAMTKVNMESADENLRSANMGFKEGVFTVTSVMEAQTAWMKASTQKIDAQIEVKLALADLKMAMGK